MLNLILIKDGEGFCEEFGYLAGLTISETSSGYIGLFKCCDKQDNLKEDKRPELFSVEIMFGEDIIILDNLKIQYIDQFNHVHFFGYKTVKI